MSEWNLFAVLLFLFFVFCFCVYVYVCCINPDLGLETLNLWNWRGDTVYICLCVCVHSRMSVCLCVCLSVCLSVCLCICLSGWYLKVKALGTLSLPHFHSIDPRAIISWPRSKSNTYSQHALLWLIVLNCEIYWIRVTLWRGEGFRSWATVGATQPSYITLRYVMLRCLYCILLCYLVSCWDWDWCWILYHRDSLIEEGNLITIDEREKGVHGGRGGEWLREWLGE